MSEREYLNSFHDSLFRQEMAILAHDVKELIEHVRHLDVKMDILQGDIDDLTASLRLHERLLELERSFAGEAQHK